MSGHSERYTEENAVASIYHYAIKGATIFLNNF